MSCETIFASLLFFLIPGPALKVLSHENFFIVLWFLKLNSSFYIGGDAFNIYFLLSLFYI
jgi:hypothetical protein